MRYNHIMIHVFYGNDTVGVRTKAYAFLAPFEEQGVRIVRIDADSFQEGVIRDAVGAVSLFGDQTAYVLDTPSSAAVFGQEVEALLQALSESPNLFVVIEGTLLAGPKKTWGKHAASMTEFSADKGRTFNVFALADSLSRKDKKTLWLGLCEAKQAGLSAEEIIGTLWWQLKTLRLAAITKNAQEAGMKDFPYNKAKRSLSYFKEGEIDHLSHTLLSVYHDGHVGVVDIDLALEQWALTL